MAEGYEAKAVDAAAIGIAAWMGRDRGYDCQLSVEALRALDPASIYVIRARSLERAWDTEPRYRCHLHLDREQLKVVDVRSDALTLDLGDAVSLDVPAWLYDSWPSVADAMNAGARAIKSRPGYIQRFPVRDG